MAATGKRIVIIGVAGPWGSDLARRLERDPSISHITGIDARPPEADLERTEFIEADIRNPLLSRILPSTEADTVVHCGILWYPEPGKPARALHDINVIGTLQLLAACQRMPTLERVVVRGSAAVYGCEGAAPFFFTEDMARRMPLRTRFQRDISELEEYFENFARRHPQIACCMLRFQPEIGPGLDTPLARYLSLPVVPTQLGFDPRLQLLHTDDATAALVAAIRSEARGPVNVAPTGSVSLSRVLRLARRPAIAIPHPIFEPALARLGERLGVGRLWGDGVRLLRYGRGVDNSRLLQDIPFEPAFDAEGAVRDFAAGVRAHKVGPAFHPGALIDRLAGDRA
ncbi:MAG: NAD-dependent epimerase/dehydratase family protein [Solirubrobacterales bacterium]